MKKKVENYRVVSVSLYEADIERIDESVKYLKSKGVSHANRSWLIRYATKLDNEELDLIADKVASGEI